MNRLLILLISFSFLLSPATVMAEETNQLTVAGWSFEVIGAAKAPTFSEIIHLGSLEDGRDWLAVSLTITNTLDEEQKIHSDRIRLQTNDELLKQTGRESEAAANEIGYRTIGGSNDHKIGAGETWQVIQVYKVAPESSDFVLVFDEFQGKWEIPITSLIALSSGDPHLLMHESTSSTPPATPMNETLEWAISTASFELQLIGAAAAPTFSGPFHLGILDDGRSWLVITYQVRNRTASEIDFESEVIRIVSGGEEVQQAGDESRSVAKELGLVAPGFKLQPGQSLTAVQVFKIDPSITDNSLKVTERGDWYLNLGPVIVEANGEGTAVVPDSAYDLANIDLDDIDPKTVPTAVPTPTSVPTPVPTETPVPTATLVPTETPVPSVTPIPTATLPPPPPTAKAQPAYYEVVEEDLQQVARVRWVVRIVIPEGSPEQIVAACADAVNSYLAIGPAKVVVVFGYANYGETDGQFTRCRAEGTSDGLGHTGDGTFGMFNSEDDGRIQVELVNGQRYYVPRD